jgi:hypothetical protein
LTASITSAAGVGQSSTATHGGAGAGAVVVLVVVLTVDMGSPDGCDRVFVGWLTVVGIRTPGGRVCG